MMHILAKVLGILFSVNLWNTQLHCKLSAYMSLDILYKMDSEMIWDLRLSLTQTAWALLKSLRHTRVWRSWLGNTQNLGISECPKSFQNPLHVQVRLSMIIF